MAISGSKHDAHMQKYAFEKSWKDRKTSTHKRLHGAPSTPCKNFWNFGSVTPEILSSPPLRSIPVGNNVASR